MFTIDRIDAGKTPVLYTLTDLLGDKVAGHFYRSQLVKAPKPEKGTYFRVEKILKWKTLNRKKYCYVKYLHYPAVSTFQVFFYLQI